MYSVCSVVVPTTATWLKSQSNSVVSLRLAKQNVVATRRMFHQESGVEFIVVVNLVKYMLMINV